MDDHNTDDGKSIDTDADSTRLLGSVALDEIDAIGRTEHAGIELPDLLDATAEVAVSPDGTIRVFLDGNAEIDGAGYLGATLLCDADAAMDLGATLIDAGRELRERDE
jgi:hypothetical protein